MAEDIALLRGINVGGRNRVPMAELRELLQSSGYRRVRTHLQSGNVLFAPTGADVDAAERDLRQLIGGRFGLDIPVVLRTGAQLAEAVARDPLGDLADDWSRYFIAFLSAEPDPAELRRAADAATGGDRCHAVGREVYLWCPAGAHDSRLAQAVMTRQLGVTATARNWRTAVKLLDMSRAGPGTG